MLRALHIRDFVIVDKLELGFAGGFTVLTGETGAGKSLLVDALSLVLGERSDTEWVREGAQKAEISAEFDLSQRPQLREALKAQDLDDGNQLVLRRVLERAGRSRAYVNGRPGTLQQLKEIGESLVDIHGQHMHQSLLRREAQRTLVDGFAGATKLAAGVAQAYRSWQALRAARDSFEKNAASLKREREEVEDQVLELKGLKVSATEWDELDAEHRRLANCAGLIETAQESLSILSEAEATVLGTLRGVTHKLEAAAQIDPALKPSLELVESGRIQLQEAVHALRHYRDRLDIDPQRLSEVESRILALHATARKFRVRPAQLASTLVELEEKLSTLALAGDHEALAKKEAQAKETFTILAKELSTKRAAAAQLLSQRVTQHLQQLSMAGSAIEVCLEALDEPASHGLERIEFMVATHSGGTPRSLGKVASGGELSRISLAIQTVTSQVADVPTLIFDEVDAGIGGGVAEIVGRMMRDLGATRQVMCVTHLPQVAAAANTQWRVFKQESTNGIRSAVQTLSEGERVEEVARMLGGVKITATTRKHAAEMIGTLAG
ncbi:MAG: DNA repair protein RecN [Betaproteobacteria bacterium]|nr:DNA repair protein RecN [Betaproteobacteria bacterium]